MFPFQNSRSIFIDFMVILRHLLSDLFFLFFFLQLINISYFKLQHIKLKEYIYSYLNSTEFCIKIA